MKKISIKQKFLLVGIIFGAFFLYSTIYNTIPKHKHLTNQYKIQKDGLLYIKQINQLIIQIQKLRGLTNIYMNGNSFTIKKINQQIEIIKISINNIHSLDNDIGTSEAGCVDPNAWVTRWETTGLANLVAKCVSIEAVTLAHEVVVHAKFGHYSQGKLLISSHWQYAFNAQGVVMIDVDVNVAKSLPSLARIGMELVLTDATNEVNWFGRGPHENYPDRILSAHIGRHSSSVNAMHTPYIFPSENGLRCDVKEAEIGDLSVTGDFHFSVSRYSQTNIAQAKHSHELIDKQQLYVRLDALHMGVGGDDSWSPSVHKEFLLDKEHYHYQITLELS